MARATYLLRKAGELVRERRYQDAVEVYLQATETDPSDSRAWFGLGVCLYRIGNLDVARIALERADKMGYPKAQKALERVEQAEQRRAAEGRGAKPTVSPAEAEKRASQRPAAAKEPPPRPTERPEQQKIDLDRYLRVMLVETIETDSHAVKQAIEGAIKHVEVVTTGYGVSTSETMSGTVHYDVAVLDWDAAPDAAAGLIQILKIKRPSLLVICLTEEWDPESAIEILEAGADYHLVKEPHFAATVPLIIAQCARRDQAMARHQAAKNDSSRTQAWPEVMNAVGEMMVFVDADYTVLQANQSAMKSLRRGQDELAGRSYCQVLYEQEEPPESCPVFHALVSGEPSAGVVRSEKIHKAFQAHAWPVFSYAGKVSGAIALLHEAGADDREAKGLKTREWLYRSLTDRANAGIAMIGSDGTLQYANAALCAMLDLAEEELLGQPIEHLVPIQDQESLRECLERAIKDGQAAERLQLQRTDGATVSADVRFGCFAQGDQSYVVLTALGVGDQDAEEKRLWSEANKLTSVLNDGIDKLECGVVVLDADGRVTWANGLAADLFGEAREALSGRPYTELISRRLVDRARNAKEFLPALTAAQKQGQALENFPIHIGGDADGEDLVYWSTPLEAGSYSVARIEHFYRAQQVPATQAALPSDAGGFAGLAAALTDMVFTADGDGRITWCNPGASATAGYGQDRLREMRLRDLAATESSEKLGGLLRQALERASHVQRGEMVMARGDGSRYWGELTLLAVTQDRSPGARIVQGVLRDVTDRRATAAIRSILNGRLPG